MTTAIGQLIEIQTDTGRWHLGRITHVVTGDVVHATLLSDGANWPEESPGDGGYTAGIGARIRTGVDKGTLVGEWRELSDPGFPSVPAASATCSVLPVAGSSPSRTLNTNWTPSADYSSRPVRVAVSGTLSCTSTLVAPQTASVELRSDSAATPTTKRADATFTLAGLAATMTVPFFLEYEAPLNDKVRLVTGGAGTVAITSVTEQPR